MDKLVKHLETIDLSGEDISRMCGLNNIIPYHELSLFHSINQVLGTEKAVILLYETKKNVGHWVLLYKSGMNSLTFFDSYGLKPDDELKYTPYNYRYDTTGRNHVGHLTSLLNKSNYMVNYNKIQLQQFYEHINTCGRYCVDRYLKKNMTNDEYTNLYLNQNHTPDYLVTVATMNL